MIKKNFSNCKHAKTTVQQFIPGVQSATFLIVYTKYMLLHVYIVMIVLCSNTQGARPRTTDASLK